jgi:hypothetical protein
MEITLLQSHPGTGAYERQNLRGYSMKHLLGLEVKGWEKTPKLSCRLKVKGETLKSLKGKQ